MMPPSRHDDQGASRRRRGRYRRYPSRRTLACAVFTANETPLTCTVGFAQCQVGCARAQIGGPVWAAATGSPLVRPPRGSAGVHRSAGLRRALACAHRGPQELVERLGAVEVEQVTCAVDLHQLGARHQRRRATRLPMRPAVRSPHNDPRRAGDARRMSHAVVRSSAPQAARKLSRSIRGISASRYARDRDVVPQDRALIRADVCMLVPEARTMQTSPLRRAGAAGRAARLRSVPGRSRNARAGSRELQILGL